MFLTVSCFFSLLTLDPLLLFNFTFTINLFFLSIIMCFSFFFSLLCCHLHLFHVLLLQNVVPSFLARSCCESWTFLTESHILFFLKRSDSFFITYNIVHDLVHPDAECYDVKKTFYYTYCMYRLGNIYCFCFASENVGAGSR